MATGTYGSFSPLPLAVEPCSACALHLPRWTEKSTTPQRRPRRGPWDVIFPGHFFHAGEGSDLGKGIGSSAITTPRESMAMRGGGEPRTRHGDILLGDEEKAATARTGIEVVVAMGLSSNKLNPEYKQRFISTVQ